MRILITNDDGIHAEGLDICAEIGRALSDDVWVVAPEFDQSGVSHSLSLNDPLRLRAVGERRFAVKGTPTDCVIMGSRHVIKDRPPNLVLSGVNRGRNAYYWIAFVRMRGLPPADGSDISALADNRIAVTPLRLDMTDEPFMTRLAELFD